MITLMTPPPLLTTAKRPATRSTRMARDSEAREAGEARRTKGGGWESSRKMNREGHF